MITTLGVSATSTTTVAITSSGSIRTSQPQCSTVTESHPLRKLSEKAKKLLKKLESIEFPPSTDPPSEHACNHSFQKAINLQRAEAELAYNLNDCTSENLESIEININEISQQIDDLELSL